MMHCGMLLAIWELINRDNGNRLTFCNRSTSVPASGNHFGFAKRPLI
jgi:hypothetical protein